MLPIDIPTLLEFKTLAAVKGDVCVSLYAPTEPSRLRERVEPHCFKGPDRPSSAALKEAVVDKHRVTPLEEKIRRLVGVDNDEPEADKIRSFRIESRIRSTSSRDFRGSVSRY
jgi:hypothetical protein